MTKQDYISLFNAMHPDFFKQSYICELPEDKVLEEMILALDDFDASLYEKTLAEGVTFGFYDGNLNKLKLLVEQVDENWPAFFTSNQNIFCGFIDGHVASFCMLEDYGEHILDGRGVRIGGPGCVGTLPKYRGRGLGLSMVKKASQILKDKGFDYSYIHYTGVARWYEKLGYKTILSWNCHGIL